MRPSHSMLAGAHPRAPQAVRALWGPGGGCGEGAFSDVELRDIVELTAVADLCRCGRPWSSPSAARRLRQVPQLLGG